MIFAVDLALGLAFGFILQKCGLGDYERVVGQFKLKNFTVLKFMGSAIVVGAVLTAALRWLGMVDDSTMPADVILPALLGGGILGCGMVIAGMCPGTLFAGAAKGRLDYLVPGFAGMIAGTLVVAAIFPSVIVPLYLGESVILAPNGYMAWDVGEAGEEVPPSGGSTAEDGTVVSGNPGSGLGVDGGKATDDFSRSSFGEAAVAEPDEFMALVQSGDMPVLDVRSRAKYEMFVMPWQALNIPVADLAVRQGELDKAAAYFLVASDDAEAARAVTILDGLGVSSSRLTILSGGSNRWVAEGRPHEFVIAFQAC